MTDFIRDPAGSGDPDQPRGGDGSLPAEDDSLLRYPHDEGIVDPDADPPADTVEDPRAAEGLDEER